MSESDIGRVRGPAGLDIGAGTPEEIAVSIFAEIVERAARPPPDPVEEEAPLRMSEARDEIAPDPAKEAGPARWATDPVCGMAVPVAASPSSVFEGEPVYFCCEGCRGRFNAAPEVFFTNRRATDTARAAGVRFVRAHGAARVRPKVRRLQEAMRERNYVAEPSIATAMHLAQPMGKPLLVEGDAGVGKTELAKAMAAVLDTELIRLQCYEGLDTHTALYEWNYQKQQQRLRMSADGKGTEGLEDVIFGRDYLLERPLLRAITHADEAPVLLVDEIDRSDEGLEAFLLELLSDFQVTIPELGTIRATHRPLVVLTSNRTREIGDALRRRCLYLYIEHPTFAKEVEIIRVRVPGVSEALADEITRVAQELRGRRLMKPPGVAETLDWARALVTLHQDRLDPAVVAETLGCLVKDWHDMCELDSGEIDALLGVARTG